MLGSMYRFKISVEVKTIHTACYYWVTSRFALRHFKIFHPWSFRPPHILVITPPIPPPTHTHTQDLSPQTAPQVVSPPILVTSYMNACMHVHVLYNENINVHVLYSEKLQFN